MVPQTAAPGKLGAMGTIAVDWSAKRAQEFVWVADSLGGLRDLRDGRTRAQVVAGLREAARAEPGTVVDLGFAFSFPRWWSR